MVGRITSNNGHYASRTIADISPRDRAAIMNAAGRIAGDWTEDDSQLGRQVTLSDGREFWVNVSALPKQWSPEDDPPIKSLEFPLTALRFEGDVGS